MQKRKYKPMVCSWNRGPFEQCKYIGNLALVKRAKMFKNIIHILAAQSLASLHPGWPDYRRSPDLEYAQHPSSIRALKKSSSEMYLLKIYKSANWLVYVNRYLCWSWYIFVRKSINWLVYVNTATLLHLLCRGRPKPLWGLNRCLSSKLIQIPFSDLFCNLFCIYMILNCCW